MPDLDSYRATIWAWLAEGRGPRLATLATQGPEGAEARMVMLRSANRVKARVEIHTDAATPKVAQVNANPGGTLLIWDPAAQMQLRLRLWLRTRPGTTGEWARVPEDSRANYGVTPTPGTPIATAAGYARPTLPDRFTVIEGLIREIDLVDLATTPHARAIFRPGDDWRGEWLAP